MSPENVDFIADRAKKLEANRDTTYTDKMTRPVTEGMIEGEYSTQSAGISAVDAARQKVRDYVKRKKGASKEDKEAA